jgi:hypothetical protein
VIGAARRRRHPFGDIGQPADDVIEQQGGISAVARPSDS